MAAAGGTMKRILLECGGKSAGIFLDDVEVTDELLERILFEGCTMHAGQACILKVGCLCRMGFTTRSSSGSPSWRARVKVGDPTDPERADGPADQPRPPGPGRGPSSRPRWPTVPRWRPAAGAPPGLDTGFYFEPTILTDVTPDSRIAQEEVFGPVLSVLALPRRRRGGRDSQQLAVRAVRRGMGHRRRPRGRRRAPRAHRSDRGKRLHPWRCAVRRIQAERLGPRGRRAWWPAPLHGTESHRNPRVMGPLEGLRVVEIAGDIAGPYCTKLLVDIGAEVTKIEPPPGTRCAAGDRFPAASPTRTGPGCSSTSTLGSAGPHLISRITVIFERARADRARAHARRGAWPGPWAGWA